MKSAVYTVFLLVGVILGTLWYAAIAGARDRHSHISLPGRF